MKKTFTTVDVLAIVEELKELVIGLRVNQIYDIDHKTYLIKLQKPDHKVVLLLESASRLHTTEYEWPKSPAPSGFSMKLRKHLRNKRLEKIEQLGVDRVVDLTFGSGEAAEHLIIELYDRGNIILTDGEYLIQNVLRPRKDGEDTRIAVGQVYSLEGCRTARPPPSLEIISNALAEAKENTALKKILNPLLDCGGGVLEHELLAAGFSTGIKIGPNSQISPEKVVQATTKAQVNVINRGIRYNKRGYIIKKKITRTKPDGTTEDAFLFEEFHPQFYNQHKDLPYDEFPSFNRACDEFFSNLEANELDKKAAQKEKEALKKLDNVRKDHMRRLNELKTRQEFDVRKGQLIELNQQLIESALLVIRSAIANQVDWGQIQELLDEAQEQGDNVARSIKALRLKSNMISMWLSDPYDFDEDDFLLDSDEEREAESGKSRPVAVDIHLDESAMANARRYYNQKRQAAQKEQKTVDASHKAIKSAEKKTHQTLKEASAVANINKARKVHWFEKHLWFISSENYLVIAGRDSQQNEVVVKRHMNPKDVYVHADLHGAASVVIKNPTGSSVPPRTLHEAGIMALCNSRAWDEKVVTSAWWVWGEQVSKTAPSGEYLTTGAFMVRGKKNFLPPSHHVYGFGFFFRLEESSIHRHQNERKVKNPDAIADDHVELEANEIELDAENDEEIEAETEDSAHPEATTKLEEIKEELNESDRDFEPNFPDTELKISHLKGDQFTMKLESDEKFDSANTGTKKVFLGDSEPVFVTLPKSNNIKAKSKPSNVPNVKIDEVSKKSNSEENQKTKRGQKGKKKKLQKYKDQDDEERELMMQLLQSDGPKKLSKKEKNAKKGKQFKTKPTPKLTENGETDKTETCAKPENKEKPAVSGHLDEQDEEEESTQIADDLSILNALTALPDPEDELLYAVPVCAPYTAMTNFKFKVKLTPGTGKKGKACKTALSLFMGDKTTSSREKDLLRAVKDHDLAKNFPGKVKVSAPNISKVKKG